ncbi:MAG TPA: SDR family oxidoreductase [Myxococcales bacterium]|jgi:3-oxoacyl-[acyl-carrier protein] reductase|nr:SDR family oxidoreductase [Myxococcales bacterium]HIL01728.1 SDR family oxidoreductase [Myxococcales bacterium]
MNLKNKAAIVTGGGTGVGRATVLRLAQAGCAVLVNYNRSRDAAEEVAGLAAASGVKAQAFKADVADDQACRTMMAEAESLFGRLDLLVNNAGTTRFIPHDDLDAVTEDDWNNILGVNLRGAFQCTRAARALLTADGGGEVVMTSSVAGLIGTGTSIPYCASKAGLNNLTVTLARVLGPEVRVNAVAPGFLDGSWLRDSLGDQYETIKGVVASRSPLGRVSSPDDVAEAILSIVAGSDLITGHVLPVEAGILIGTP